MIHNKLDGQPNIYDISPASLQFLHMSAQIECIDKVIRPTFDGKSNGYVILDRYWWSTYAYGRLNMDKKTALAICQVEVMFWRNIPNPVIFYMTRKHTLKKDELNVSIQEKLRKTYKEIVDIQSKNGIEIHIINNDGSIEDTWQEIIKKLQSSNL